MVSCLFIPHPPINYYCLQKKEYPVFLCLFGNLFQRPTDLQNIPSELMNWPNISEDGKYFTKKIKKPNVVN